MTLDEALIEIQTTVRDQAGKLAENTTDVDETPDAFRVALGRGLAFYSQLKPRRVTTTVAVGANGRLPVSSIANFCESFVSQLKIEYPIIPMGRPYWLDADDWILDQDSNSALEIRFVFVIPPLGSLVRIAHFCEHVIPVTDAFTVPAADMQAVIHFSADAALTMLADEYAQASEAVIASAQIANFVNKSGIYAARAASERKKGFEFLRIGRLRAQGEATLVRG